MKPLNLRTIPQPQPAGDGKPAFATASDTRQGAGVTTSRLGSDAAFMVRDLVSLLAAVAAVAGLTAFSSGFSRTNGQTAVCLSNLQQLTRAWQAYAADDRDRLVNNFGVSEVLAELTGRTFRNWANNV